MGRGALNTKPHNAEIGSDVGEEKEVHPTSFQIFSVNGQAKEIMMRNDGTLPVCSSLRE